MLGARPRERRASVEATPASAIFSEGEGHLGSCLAAALEDPVVTTVWPAWAAERGGRTLRGPTLPAHLVRLAGALEARLAHRQDLTLTATRWLHGRYSAGLARELGTSTRVATALHAGALFREGRPRVLDFPMSPPATWNRWRELDTVGFCALRSPLAARVAERLVAREVAAADVVVALSSPARRELQSQWPAARVETILPGVDPIREQSPRPGRAVVYVGAIERQKGVGDLLDALDAHPNIELVCAGPGSRWSRDLVDRICQRPCTRYVGSLSPDARDNLLSRARVVVVPSHHEGFGLVILEAMAAGVPVIATTATGGPDAGVGDFGWLVPPGDRAALGAAVSEASQMTDAERRDRGQRALDSFHERRFHAAAFVARWQALIERLDDAS